MEVTRTTNTCAQLAAVIGGWKVQMPDKECLWNRCDVCGQFIPFSAFGWRSDQQARREILTPDSEFTKETWETLCPKHNTREEVV